MSNQKQFPGFQSYKMLYLIGINEAKEQVLVTFRYKEVNSIPVLQLVHEHMGMDGKRSIQYSDVHVEHGAKHIRGGVPSPFGFSKGLPIFIFSRDLMELKFIFDDVPMSALIMQDTAIPFVQLISRM